MTQADADLRIFVNDTPITIKMRDWMPPDTVALVSPAIHRPVMQVVGVDFAKEGSDSWTARVKIRVDPHLAAQHVMIVENIGHEFP